MHLSVLLMVPTALAALAGANSGGLFNGHLIYEIGAGPAGISHQSEPLACSWVFSDADTALSGFQHGDDFDPLQEPGFPCAVGDEATEAPSMADGAFQSAIQVLPGPRGGSQARKIESWAAVGKPGEVDEVSWRVLYPDGALKLQATGDKVSAADLRGLGSTNSPGTMWHAAHETGQVSADAISARDHGLIDLASRGQVELYFAEWEVSADEPCGRYTVETAATTDGSTSTLTSTLDVQCHFNLEVDVDKVFWGLIGRIAVKTVPGDLRFIADGSSPATTARFEGAVPGQFGVEFLPMFEVDPDGRPVPNGTTLDRFTAASGFDRAEMQWFNSIPANKVQWFDREDLRCLGDEETVRVDLSVIGHETVSSLYNGVLTIWTRLDEGCLELPPEMAEPSPEP